MPLSSKPSVAASARAGRWHAKIYRAVLGCYPREFRDEYAREMCLMLVDDCRSQRSVIGVIGVWARALSDAAQHAPQERLRMWWQDVRYGIRMLRKDALTTLTALVVLALGIGGTTTVFTLVNALLLRPLPYAEPERLVAIDEFSLAPTSSNGGNGGTLRMAFANYADLRARARSVEDIALYDSLQPVLRDEYGAERVEAEFATDGLWRVLGVKPLMGRGFTKSDTTPKQPLAVVLSYHLWQRRYGGAPDVLTRTINVSGFPATIVGVMPPGFQFPNRAEMWVPVRDAVTPQTRSDHEYEAIARLRPGVTVEAAEREFSGLLRQILTEHRDADRGQSARVRPFRHALTDDYRASTWMLLGTVALVLLIACANVANLLLVKATIRGREMALRGALGAPRRRLVRQMLVESLLLTTAGAAAGIAVAIVALPAILALVPVPLPVWVTFAPDLRVIVFITTVLTLSGLAVGLVPALSASRHNLVEVLNEGGRSRGASPRQRFVRDSLIVAEVALSMLLLVGASLMLRSYMNITQQPLGFDAERLVTFRTSVPAGYNIDNKGTDIIRRVRDELVTLPGVASVAAATNVPLQGIWNRRLVVEGHALPEAKDTPFVNASVITPGYFATLGVRVVEGREFTEEDGATPRVTIVDEALARRYWPGQSAIGKRVRYGPPDPKTPWHTVIGVVASIRNQSLIEAAPPDVYVPHNELRFPALRYVVRTATGADPAALVPLLRARVLQIDRAIEISDLRPLDDTIHDSIWQPRFFTILLAVFAVVALTMAVVGLNAMVSNNVSQRRHELGVRAALGASRGTLRWMMTSQSLIVVIVGIVLGGAASFALREVMAAQLFGVSPTDPSTLAGAALALALVATLASYWPAWRATKADPSSVLRE
jgi:putative ABC transport system permease protein